MNGYRKLAFAAMTQALSTVAVGMGWIEGMQYASLMTLVAGSYLASNVAAKAQAKV